MAEVILENVTKKFGDVTVVKGINLQIKDGEFMVLVGPSGCGKTTLLRLVAGLEELTEGKIIINGRVMNQVPPKDRDLAMVFQKLRPLSPHERLRQHGFRAEDAQGAQGGDRQPGAGSRPHPGHRNAAASASPSSFPAASASGWRWGAPSCASPSVFLFDEPLSNLDAKLRGQMRAEISKLHLQLKTTSIYVTHDQVEAMTMGSKIAIVNEGVIQQSGTPMDIYDTPVNKFVAGFIGSPPMNFFEAVIQEENGRIFMARPTGSAAHWQGELANKAKRHGLKEYLFGIRPENLHDAEFFEKVDGCEVFSGQVEVVEPMGAETYVHAHGTGKDRFVARVTPKTGARVGQPMQLIIETAKVHVFDKKTLQALR